MDHTMTDKVLLDRLSGGDEGALNDIYLLYWEGLFLSAFNVLKDKAACEDILQDLFLQLWQKRNQIQINSSLSAYLYTAVRYNVFRHIRTGKVRNELFMHIDERVEGLVTEQMVAAEERELNQKVAQAVAALPEKCREVYILSREEELSHKEIASKLNISTKTVENQITIALKRVRSSLNTLSIVVLLFLSL
ncbi:RNA polymerase sigma-70 factor [Filimonas effusa]|uniref:RNA polymerase sigma-70 factor n=1 Tax=Filimonas effusa TaxID=2508721 RepID=A0A4Q1DAQ5_9BACT|nr:RNA polymerase sigma-70 factor [Filimonas effusa]RXK86504.1 RNA polymerase sigma-70 factor [Filimonas effusa]